MSQFFRDAAERADILFQGGENAAVNRFLSRVIRTPSWYETFQGSTP